MPYAIALNHDNGAHKLCTWNAFESVPEPSYAFGLAEITDSEKDEPGRQRLFQGKQTRVIEIGRDYDSGFCSRALDDLNIRRALQRIYAVSFRTGFGL